MVKFLWFHDAKIKLLTCGVVFVDKVFPFYESPFSEETKKMRLNCILMASVCFFISLSGSLPKELTLLGLKFAEDQQDVIGWFLLIATAYVFLHFVTAAMVEVAHWIHPAIKWQEERKRLLEDPRFDESDFMNLPDFERENELDQIKAEAEHHAERVTQKKLRFFYGAVFIKLILDIIFPVIFTVMSISQLFMMLQSASV